MRVGVVPETVADYLAADGLIRAPRVTGHQVWTASRPLKGPAAQHPEREGAGVAAISCLCLLRDPFGAAIPQGSGPQRADVSRARQPAITGHQRPIKSQPAPFASIQTYGFGLQNGYRSPFRGSFGGPVRDDFPANGW